MVTPNYDGKKSWMACAVVTASNLKEHFDVTVLTSNTEGQFDYEELDGVKIYRVKSFLLPDPVNMSVPNVFRFWKLLGKLKADIIIINKTWFVTSLLASIYYRLKGIKYFVQLDTLVGKIWFGMSKIMNIAMWLYARTLNRFILGGAKKCICYHEGLVPVMKEWNLSYEVISQGVDVAKFSEALPAQDILKFKDGRFCFLFVGRLDDIKRWQKYRDCCKTVHLLLKNKVCFVWVVGGKHPEKRKALQNEMKWHNTKVLGFRSDVANIMKSCDMFVLPSRCEGMPDVVLEAQASGLCCLASNVGGIPHLIRDLHNGYLFDSFIGLQTKMLMAPLFKPYNKMLSQKAFISVQEHDNANVTKKLVKILNVL